MRILILNDDYPPAGHGGASSVASDLAKALSKNHTVAVVTTVAKREDAGAGMEGDIKIWRAYSNYHERWRAWISLFNPGVLSRLKKIINEFKPDVVHAHNIHFHLSYHALRLAKRYGARVVLTAHDVMLFNYGKLPEGWSPTKRISAWSQARAYRFRYNPFRNLIIRFYLRYVDKLIAVSAMLKDALAVNGIKMPIVVIPNGVDVLSIKSASLGTESFRIKYKLSDKRLILCAGRWSRGKGLDSLAHSLKELFRTDPTLTLVIAGMSAQEALNLGSNRCVGLGWLSRGKLAQAYQIASVTVVPSSSFDTFNLVAAEALATGCPVVVSRLAGISDLVLEYNAGLVVDPANSSRMLNAIKLLLDDEGLRKRVIANGVRLVKERLDLNQIVKHTESLYKSNE